MHTKYSYYRNLDVIPTADFNSFNEITQIWLLNAMF